MKPKLVHVSEAYLNAKLRIRSYRIILAVVVVVSVIGIALLTARNGFYGRLFAVACSVILLQLLVRLYGAQHRAGVLHKIQSGGVVINTYKSESGLILFCLGEMFSFSRTANREGCYMIDFKNMTYEEGRSIQSEFTL